MYSYIIGKITQIENNYIVLETNKIGYLIYTANPYSFKDEEIKIYLYQNIKEDENTLYGFSSIEEKNLFLKLISVKGLGCKMALPMIALGSIQGIIEAIEKENIIYLKKFPKIGDKVARQIILDLKGKLTTSTIENNKTNEELESVLKSLGYKAPDIKKVMQQIDFTTTIEEQIKQALKLMLK
ncbi:MAG: Holliday junction branch migration protein RuvA [Mycoplasmatota bacterium]